jgi:hypothetical protein
MRIKLAAYSLDLAHKHGGPKARGFKRILGIAFEDIDYLEEAIETAILDTPISQVRDNSPHGVNCVVDFQLQGASRQAQPRRQGPHRVGAHRTRRAAPPCNRLPKPLDSRRAMATVKHAIGEIDVVELRQAVGKWPAGTSGTVVSDHGGVKLIEISDEEGRMLDLISVPESQLKLTIKYSG